MESRQKILYFLRWHLTLILESIYTSAVMVVMDRANKKLATISGISIQSQQDLAGKEIQSH